MPTWIRDPTHAAYFTQSQMENNALCVRDWFYANTDWTINAIAGLVANFEGESTINPDSMENPNLPIGTVNSDGLGLAQWTTDDGNAGNPLFIYLDYLFGTHADWGIPDRQLKVLTDVEYKVADGSISNRFPVNGYVYQAYPWLGTNATYPLSFAQWAHSTANPGYLAMHFQKCNERPRVLDPNREQMGNDWYQFLTGHPPTPVPTTRKGLKVWQMIRYHL